MFDRAYRFVLTYALPSLMLFCMLWKGGKSLEATWLLAGVTWLLTLAHFRVRGEGQRIPTAFWVGFLTFIGWTVAAYLMSKTRNYGLDEVLRDGSFFLLTGIVAREASAQPAFVGRFLRILCIGAMIACIIGIAVYCLQPVNRFVGTFFDYRFQTDYWPNAWADFVLLSWPLLLWKALLNTAGKIWDRNRLCLGLLGLGAFIGCFFLSYSRGAFLAFLGQLVLMAILSLIFMVLPLHAQEKRPGFLLKHLFPPLKLTGGFTLTVCGLAIVLGMAFVTFEGVNAGRSLLFPVQSVMEKATFTAAEGDSSITERSSFWHQAFALSLDHPWIGWGPYSFRFAQPRLQNAVFATSDHPHNVFLKMALERGWPAAVLLAFLVLSIFWFALSSLWRWRGRLRHASGILGSPVPLWSVALLQSALLTAFVGTLLHSQIDYNLQFVANGLLLWIEGGLILALALSDRPQRESRAKATIEVLVATLLVIIAVLEGRYLITSSLGRHEEARHNTTAALAWYKQSKDEWFSRDMHLSRTHLLLDAGMPDAALRTLDDYFAVNTEDARAWLLKAEAQEEKADWKGALASYTEALRLGKYNYVDALRGVIAMSVKTGDRSYIDGQEVQIEKLLKNYADAIEHNVHFIALTPNVESLGQTLDLMSTLFPKHAPSYADMKQKTSAHAREERMRLEARTPGLLW